MGEDKLYLQQRSLGIKKGISQDHVSVNRVFSELCVFISKRVMLVEAGPGSKSSSSQ